MQVLSLSLFEFNYDICSQQSYDGKGCHLACWALRHGEHCCLIIVRNGIGGTILHTSTIRPLFITTILSAACIVESLCKVIESCSDSESYIGTLHGNKK